jgi:hypothetical protein
MPSPDIDTFTIVALKVDNAAARERIGAFAKAFGVTIDAIAETPKHFEVELAVSVTGDRESIDALRDELTRPNSASESSFFTGPISVVLDPITDLVGGAAADRFKRWRAEHADRRRPDEPPAQQED